MNSLEQAARNVMENHGTELGEIRKALATNFDVPAQRSINAGFARMDVPRFTRAGDDLWEMIVALENGTEYQKPPRRLVDRWAAY